MYEFIDRLISLAIPRVRDFRGLSSKAFDHNGNYSMGLVEQVVFPELNPDKYTRVQGMNITFVTSTSSDDEARELLAQLGVLAGGQAGELGGAGADGRPLLPRERLPDGLLRPLGARRGDRGGRRGRPRWGRRSSASRRRGRPSSRVRPAPDDQPAGQLAAFCPASE